MIKMHFGDFYNRQFKIGKFYFDIKSLKAFVITFL